MNISDLFKTPSMLVMLVGLALICASLGLTFNLFGLEGVVTKGQETIGVGAGLVIFITGVYMWMNRRDKTFAVKPDEDNKQC